jgi:DNA primase
MLKRFASRVVLAFDADAAGQGAAEKFYEWEQKYQVQVSVAAFPKGKDPGELSQSDPQALAAAVDTALPFLGFRLQRVMTGRALNSPEDRARLAEQAMAVVNEHPDANVRKLYAGQVASHTGLPINDLVAIASRRSARPVIRLNESRRVGTSENAEFVAIALLLQRWHEMAGWLDEVLFVDDVARRAFLAVAEGDGSVGRSLDLADPEARELIERAAVADIDADPSIEGRNLIAAAVRRELARRVNETDPNEILANRDARLALERFDEPATGNDAAELLLGWLQRRNEERG